MIRILAETTPPIYPATNDSDQQLLLLIQQQDPQAFETLYYRYYALLCTKAFARLQDEPVVEELVQDVFVNLWTRAAQLDPNGNVAGYLFATLRNKVLYEIRTRSALHNKQQQYQYLHGTTGADTPANDPQDKREALEQLNKVLAQLPPKCREAFVLSRGKNLTYQQIAEQMQISVKTVEKHIGKALRILKNELGEREFCLVVIMLQVFI
jgi:RNA polymerase sigma-70 factor (ECF subfamily)